MLVWHKFNSIACAMIYKYKSSESTESNDV